MLGKLIDWSLKKEWSNEQVQNYVGSYKASYLARNRFNSSSKRCFWGVVSALLIHGLHSIFLMEYDLKTVLINGKVRAKFEIATTIDEVLDTRE